MIYIKNIVRACMARRNYKHKFVCARRLYVLLLLTGLVLIPARSRAAYAVFDATNNILATLQKTMDSAFQSVQKANMTTLIKQAREDYAEQIKIYQECVKQYEESVKIYNQAVEMYDWIDANVGNARNLKTFLSCGFSDTSNLRQLATLVSTTMKQTGTVTNADYNTTLLQQADRIAGNDVFQRSAKQGVETQNHGQTSEKIADRSDSLSLAMLTRLRTKDQVLESKVNSGTADLMQIVHANEQVSVFIAEELSRMNSNISAINRSVSRNLEINGRRDMNKAQEAAASVTLEHEAISRGVNYSRQENSWKRIDKVFDNCRRF
ncbi:MAG: hypothetical protein JXR78_16670 [Victivallales bacterium]|nr:hypothetical protein [Victivallales bacterium]